MRSDIQAIIFDCDGVLVDSEGPSNAVLVKLAQAEGIQIDLDYALQNFQGHALSYVFEKLEQLKGTPLSTSFEAQFRLQTFASFEKNIPAIPGALKLLQKLNCPIAVASNGPRNKMSLTLKGAGLLAFFEEHIFSAYDIGHWKPEPQLFLHAAQALGVIPEQTIVVEDSPAGLEAAMAGGFQTFALYNRHNEERIKRIAGVKMIRHLDELTDYLEL